jgi:hypothetical protein
VADSDPADARAQADDEGEIALGERRTLGGRERVYYYGYWIKAYPTPADTLLTKKRLIEALTRRLFNHVEHGVNVPGTRLAEARAIFGGETDPARRRVQGAMLAGALFNRATDVITKLVEIQALGMPIEPDNALMRECGDHLQEAIALGRLVLHRSGEEGIDELWGEPFKAFLYPIEKFYESRYIKIAQCMRQIDEIRDELTLALDGSPAFAGVRDRIALFADAAKLKCETLRTDEQIFEIWTELVVSGERLAAFEPALDPDASAEQRREAADGAALIKHAKDLVFWVTRARVPMPKSTADFAALCRRFRAGPEARSPARTVGVGAVTSVVTGVSAEYFGR